MAELVVRLEANQYVIWSDTVDAPVTAVMDRTRAVVHLENVAGLAANEVGLLMDQVDLTGISDSTRTVDSLLATSRAGPEEEHLSLSELLRRYR